MITSSLIQVIQLNDFYRDQVLVASVRMYHRLVLLTDGRGMLFIHSGADYYIKQFSSGMVVLFSDLLFDDFLLRHPGYRDALLFDYTNTFAFIPLSADVEDELFVFVDRLAAGIDRSLGVQFLRPLLDLLLVNASEIYAGLNHIPLNTWEAGKMREFRLLIGEKLHLRWVTADYAFRLNVTPRKLSEICRRFTGRNVLGELNARRLAEAQRQLLLTGKAIKEIALELGYDNQALFTTFFTKMKGMSPSAYRRVARGK